jgi:hypothetical protein
MLCDFHMIFDFWALRKIMVYNQCVTGNKGFCEKNAPKLLDFEE